MSRPFKLNPRRQRPRRTGLWWSRFRAGPLAALLVTLFALGHPALAQTLDRTNCAMRAGIIARIEGYASDVTVIPQGASDGAFGAPLMPLCEGDRVVVRGDTTVVLRINGVAKAVRRGDETTTFVVPKRSGSQMDLRNAIDFLYQQFWPDIHRSSTQARMRSLEGGDDPRFSTGPLRFLVPGVASGAARLSLRSQSEGLMLKWAGGPAPFELRISDASGTERYHSSGIQSRTHVASLPLDPGAWKLVVTDASGAQLRGSFVAVAEAAPVPPEWDPARIDDSLRVLWLAKCQREVWSLQALQDVAGRRAGSMSSQAMFRILERYAEPGPNAPPAEYSCVGP